MGYNIRPDHEAAGQQTFRIDDFVDADHVARWIRDVVDAEDLTALGFEARVATRGRPPLSTDLLVKAWLYGFLEGFRSTRRLAWACANVPAALWLTGLARPDHNTLSRFFRANLAPCRALFARVVRVAAHLGLVGLVVQAVDGTKITAASSMHTGLHRARLDAALARLDAAIETMIARQLAEPADDLAAAALPAALADAQARRDAIAAARAHLDAVGKAHEHPGEPEVGVLKHGVKREFAYNAQAVADATHQLVVAAEVCTDANDSAQLEPMLAATAATVGAVADHTLADAGYHNNAQLAAAQAAGHDVVLSGLQGDRGGPYDKARFTYDAATDTYTCPRKVALPLWRTTTKDDAPCKVYRCPDATCPVRGACAPNRRGTPRTVHRGPHDAALEVQRARQQAPDAAALAARRKALIEPVFGWIKHNLGWRRFTVRGLAKVRAQWALLCLTVNLKKLRRLTTRSAWREAAARVAYA